MDKIKKILVRTFFGLAFSLIWTLSQIFILWRHLDGFCGFFTEQRCGLLAFYYSHFFDVSTLLFIASIALASIISLYLVTGRKLTARILLTWLIFVVTLLIAESANYFNTNISLNLPYDFPNFLSTNLWGMLEGSTITAFFFILYELLIMKISNKQI